jgi:hypothetical protein
MQKIDIDGIKLPPENTTHNLCVHKKPRKRASRRFSQVFSSIIDDECLAPKGDFIGAQTMNRIDSCTENYVNPMDTYVQSQGLVAHDLPKLDNPDGIDV